LNPEQKDKDEGVSQHAQKRNPLYCQGYAKCALALDHEFAPNVDKLTMDSPAPLLAGPDGKYPVPQPGITVRREY